ncbi:MAG: C40 family peptidase [Clostridiales bacterium]|nr:C40 family peptidase [Clostridiales bacterium]
MQSEFYYIKRPSVFIYSCPDSRGGVSDELLYGTKIRLISEKTMGSFYRCETSYGYSGFIKEKDFSAESFPDALFTYTVCSCACDVLPGPEYKNRPLLTLPKGSLITSNHRKNDDDRFLPVIFGKSRCYVPSACVREYYVHTAPHGKIKNKSAFRKRICDDALSYVGTPYRWGGKSSSGIDCSGLCFMAYYLNGITLFRDSFADKRYVSEIKRSELLPADLIYFKGHMGLYIGDGEFVHASASAGYVTVSSLEKESIIYNKKLASSVSCFARSVLL